MTNEMDTREERLRFIRQLTGQPAPESSEAASDKQGGGDVE